MTNLKCKDCGRIFTEPVLFLGWVEIGNYRVDFELINHKDKKIIVECDGHEFHQKSKQQVEKDNQRERDLKKLGYEVVRFSGSEIFKDAEKCVEDLLDILNR